jgi:hypothetical protein
MSRTFDVQIESAAPLELPSQDATHRARRAVLDSIAYPSRPMSRKRGVVVGALAGLCAAVAITLPAVALGTHWWRSTTNFKHATPAPSVVRKQFGELYGSAQAPPGMDPRVLPLATRKAGAFDVNGSQNVLWVAPTSTDGYCWVFTALGGGCHANREILDRGSAQGGLRPWLVDVSTRVTRHGNEPARVTSLSGVVSDARAVSLTVSYANGQTTSVPFVWVTAPIEAGFFALGIPESHQLPVSRPTHLSLYDSQGALLAETSDLPSPSAFG